MYKFGIISCPELSPKHRETYPRYWSGTFDFENETLHGCYYSYTPGGTSTQYRTIASVFADGVRFGDDGYIKLIYNGTKIEVWAKYGVGESPINFDLTVA